MTSAGTSLADMAHQLADQASGWWGGGGPEGAETSAPGQHSGNANEDGGQAGDGDMAPGHHPDDPKSTVNQGATDDTLPASSDQQPPSSDGRGGSSTQPLPDRKEGDSQKKKQRPSPEDPIDKALGSKGPVADALHLDTSAGQMPPGGDSSMREATAGAAIGEPVRSTRNDPDAASAEQEESSLDDRQDGGSKGKKEGWGLFGLGGGKKKQLAPEAEKSTLPPEQEHPANRGPMWASRPTQEQREKIEKMKQERAQRPGMTRIDTPDAAKSDFAKAASTPPASARDDPLSQSPTSPQDDKGGKSPSRTGGLKAFLGGGERGGSYRGSSSTRPSPLRTQWSENNRSMRGAFEAPPEKDDDDGDASHSPSSPVQEKSAPTSTVDSGPMSATSSKMRSISKIMVGRSTSHINKEDEPKSAADRTEDSADGQQGDTPNTPTAAAARWSALKHRIMESGAKKGKGRNEKRQMVQGLDLTMELQSGILPVFLLKMSLERDEQKHRRIPVLLNHVRLRVTDSVNPLSNTHAVFRIELEYGDGLVKWVVYRELRDFINLHAHYRAAALRDFLGRPTGSGEGDSFGLPSFPKTSLPYFNQLQRQGWGKGSSDPKADFARVQRDALENYIIELIRRTMFRPEANRLCKFFEISALSVSLASRGGFQGKQGYLRILSKSSRKKEHKGILTPISWVKSHEPKWCIVRESYIAIVDQPDTLQVYDVFLMDTDFAIERPKRLYKQTINLAADLRNGGAESEVDEAKAKLKHVGEVDGDDEAAPESKPKSRADKRQDTNDNPQSKAALLTEGMYTKDDDGGSDLEDVAGGSKKKKRKGQSGHNVSSHTFYIKNSERRLKLVAHNERHMDQFIASMERVASRNIFSGANRFGSFAPIRLHSSAKWLVDGRDYFWNVCKALEMAKDRIFIHDWWLSPELYLRRPGKPQYRLDNILKRKAEEGVKIMVILYQEVSNSFTPTDSNYTKQRLIGLHRNIFVQRSPSHFQTGTFYWAHHEKLCVIDETIAFMGGLDLCFGRWDTPAHVLVDDAEMDLGDGGSSTLRQNPKFLGPERNGAEAHIWPGMDWANERIEEWHTLHKPEMDLFPRDKFPRMPWHDTGLQLVGQPARDLCRHFIQRWNYLLRIKNHSRTMPFLVPPPDFTPAELTKYDITGTCETQICRSAGPWSLGTTGKVEHSIQTAYLKAIQMSDHFVYIENQFFVTATVVEGTPIENSIGEALVSRIIRAHREGTPWRAIIVIPLIPGFPMPIDHPDASSVRIIVECQMRSMCRGPNSIFGKLRREGIRPDDYISFFSLRNWGKLRYGQLTSEQVYIHGKCMVVDDRLAIIGSANINERSQRGDRDSELACVIRDTDMVESTMAGKPYKVGRFAHTLRMRLMREHLGVDVDEIAARGEDELVGAEASMSGSDGDEVWDPDDADHDDWQGQDEADVTRHTHHTGKRVRNLAGEVGSGISDMATGARTTARSQVDLMRARREQRGDGGDHSGDEEQADEEENRNVMPTLEETVVMDKTNGRGGHASPGDVRDRSPARRASISGRRGSKHGRHPSTSSSHVGDGERERGDHVTDEMRRKVGNKGAANPWAPPIDAPVIDAYGFADPVADSFYKNVWSATAVHNTQIYRKVFRCVPDDTVATWSDYKAFSAWSARLSKSGKGGAKEKEAAAAPPPPSSTGAGSANGHVAGASSAPAPNGTVNPGSPSASNKGLVPGWTAASEANSAEEDASSVGHGGGGDAPARSLAPSEANSTAGGHSAQPTTAGSTTGKSAGAPAPSKSQQDEGFSERELEQMEALLEETKGFLVVHPLKFLEAESAANNFVYPLDWVGPLQVYV